MCKGRWKGQLEEEIDAFLVGLLQAGFEFSHQELSWSSTSCQFGSWVKNPSNNTISIVDVNQHRIISELERTLEIILIAERSERLCTQLVISRAMPSIQGT